MPCRSSALRVFYFLLLIAAATATPIMAQPPEPAENRLLEQVYLAKDDGLGKPGDEFAEFGPHDIPIHCVVVLSNVQSATVKMELIAVGVAGVKPETKVVSASYITSDFQDRVYFTGSPRGAWVPGDYRADIYINGNLVQKLPFRVRGPAGPAKPGSRADPKQTTRQRSASARKNN